MRDLKKIFLTAGAVAAVGATASIGTFAGFTATDSVSGNSFATGTVIVDAEGAGASGPVLTLTDMAIGDSTTGTITVKNTGTIRSSYAISAVSATGDLLTDAGANDFGDRLKIEILDENGTPETVVPNQTVSTFLGAAATPVALGTGGSTADSLNAGEQRTYRVNVTLPGSTPTLDNPLQNKTGAITFKVDAAQRNGAARTSGTDTADTPAY
jgi:hypothetical protein